MTEFNPTCLGVNLIFLEETNYKFRKIRIFFIGSGELKGSIKSVEDGPYFQEKVIFNRTNVDDILFHEESALKSLEKDIKIWSQEFYINFIILDILLCGLLLGFMTMKTINFGH